MPNQFEERLALFAQPDHLPLLTQINRGIEKESLRVTPNGELAQTAHPKAFGSALTNAYITTDFSESLIELITPVSRSIDDTLNCLSDIHRFVYSKLGDEQLWTTSMPCILGDDEQIPLAQYGSSNVATMKTAYRRGLSHRYGRKMQTIAGIHYNFSVPTSFWPLLQNQDFNKQAAKDYITEAYFQLIRNFRRCSWLLIYLFGASPAVCRSFLDNQSHNLDVFDDHSLYLPYGTSLRMGDLGYQSNAQQSLNICYNSVDNYINTLLDAITHAHPDYEKIGLKVDGVYQQLSTSLLQIENEFYSPIRPKRVSEATETPLHALHERGVEYIEVRCIDVNPYLPLGIDAEQIRFIDCFLLYCLFDQSPFCDDVDRQRIHDNQSAIVNNGREPNLRLQRRSGPTSIKHWGEELIGNISRIAELMDQAHGGELYRQSCARQLAKMRNPKLTPSAQLLKDMREQQLSFVDFALRQSEHHRQSFADHPLSEADQARFEQSARQSLADQQAIEDADNKSFDDYLADYFRQYQQLKE